MHILRTIQSIKQRQHGAVFIVMMVIMVLGTTAFLVSSLNSASLQIARDQVTADALAKAKEALIGRAVADTTSPGSLPCPDLITNTTTPIKNVPNDGIADSLLGNNCPSYIGRLPWKTLGLPDLRDGSGERLWYALSPNFRDYYPSNPINSDTQGTLSIFSSNGTTQITATAIAIVFAPGDVINSRQRDNQTDQNIAQNYLDTYKPEPPAIACNDATNGCNNALPTGVFLNSSKIISTTTNQIVFNDQTIYITHDQLFTSVEKRIGREVKSCLDNYAASSASKYPWAAPVTDTSYQGAANTYFGRVPAWPIPSPDQNVVDFLSALINLQSALANYIASNNATTRNALDDAGSALKDIAKTVKDNQPTQPAISSNTTTAAKNTGDQAQDLAKNPPQTTVQNVQNLLASTISNLQQSLSDTSMQPVWPSGCMFSSTYWSAWQSEVFYQVAQGYQPGSSATFSTPLTINGTGTYRAALAVAGQALPSQTPRILINDASYLEANTPVVTNQHQTTPSTNFITYSPSSPNYSTVNDLVLCLDGKGTNPSSVCQ